MEKLINLIKEKRVLFITTKNIDYIRNTQEIRILKENARSVDIICSNKKNNPLRILHVWTQMKKKRIRENEIIFVGFEPQFVIPFFCYKVKNKFIVVDFFISVYDTLIFDRKKFKEQGIVSKFCRWMDMKTIKMADHIITDTKAHSKYFINEFEGNEDKFETIYLEADSSIYYPRHHSKPDDLKGKYVVLYFGSILPLQGIDIILDAVRLINNKEYNIFFEIIGPIHDKYDKPIQKNVCYYDWLSQEELAKHIAYSDLCLAGHFNENIEKAKRTIAGKTYIYEMMNKMMILGDGEANHELFEEDSKHLFVKMGDANELAQRIVQAYLS